MKRGLCILLILCLALLPVAAFAADSSVCFIAINDDLLPLTSQATSQGGQYYVPAGVLNRLRIYNTYHSSISTEELFSSSRQMFFNVSTGETWDSENNYYSASAIVRGSTVYVPVDFVCRQFGLSWSYIRGSGYGDVCRIMDGSASLSDADFMTAARPLMASRYNEYTGTTIAPNDTDTGTETADSVVFLSFRGLPGDGALSVLSSHGVKATFFLTAGEVLEDPDTVRRLVGEGHNVGALCSSNPQAEYAALTDALWTEAHLATVLVASASFEYNEVCESWADANGLAYCSYTIDGVRGGDGMTVAELTSALAGGRAPLMYLRLESCATTDANLSAILNVLASGSVILADNETSGS